MKEPDWPTWLFKRAIEHLGRFSSSKANLSKILERKVLRKIHRMEGGEGWPNMMGAVRADIVLNIADVITKCQDLGYVDDKVYARSRCRLLVSKGRPVARIKADLISKGVPDEIIEWVMSEKEIFHNKPDLKGAIAYMRRRRFGAYHYLLLNAPAKSFDKQMSAMMRAGFSPDLVRMVLDHPDPQKLLEEEIT